MDMIFQYFFVWVIGKKNGDFSILPLSKDFWRLLFIYIYHISVFFFETMIHCFSIQNWEISILKKRFVSNLFFNLSIFFSRAFSPFGMEKSPFRMEISPFKLFQTRYEPFFKMCFSCFFQISPSNFWTEISPYWMEFFSILTTDFCSCIQNKENSILNWQISILRKKILQSKYRFFFNCFLHSEWRSGEISILNGEISSFWI